MAERRHGAALQETHAGVTGGPLREALEAEFRPPTQATRNRRKALLEDAPQPHLGAEMVDQDDLAAGFGHARNLVERGLGVRHRGDHILRHDDVEKSVGEGQVLRIHHRERLDMGELVLGDALMRLAQHRLAIIDPDHAAAGE